MTKIPLSPTWRGGLASRGQIDRSERVGCSFEHAPVFVGQTYSVMKVEGISRVDGVQSLNFERQLMGNTLQVVEYALASKQTFYRAPN